MKDWHVFYLVGNAAIISSIILEGWEGAILGFLGVANIFIGWATERSER